MKYKVFTPNKIDHMHQPLFFGDVPDVARYDIQQYPILEKLVNKQLGFFWRPEEIDLTKDANDFKLLTEGQKHIFLSNLKYQILLDSVQGRAPTVALLPVVSLPELETLIQTWSFFETIHSRSYSHIIRNLVSNPAEVFDTITLTPEILERAKDVTKYYDDFIEYSTYYNLLGIGKHTINGNKIEINLWDLKVKFYLMLISINILEGVRFYASFACSFAFSELKLMNGNSKIIELIARDENLHLAIVQNVIKILKSGNDTQMLEVISSKEPDVYAMYDSTILQEKQWCEYLFQKDSMIGLNATLLGNYVEYIANKRMKTIGLKPQYKQPHNPLSWTLHYLQSSSKAVAPQEEEVTSYVHNGGLKADITEDTFSDFEL